MRKCVRARIGIHRRKRKESKGNQFKFQKKKKIVRRVSKLVKTIIIYIYKKNIIDHQCGVRKCVTEKSHHHNKIVINKTKN